MAKNYVQEGCLVTLTAPYVLTAGQGALVGAIFGVAQSDIANGVAGTFALEGVHTLAKATGQAWTQGALVYWDNTNKVCTNVSTSNTRIGFAMAAQLSGDTTAQVRLNGMAAPTGA